MTTNLIKPLPSWKNIARAMTLIDPTFLRSPIARHPTLDDKLGCRIISKVESINPIRSFKGRGTSLYVTSRRDELAAKVRLVSASAGNFGQGLAYAARTEDLPLTVFAPTTANPAKVAAMRGLGAEVILEGEDFDLAKQNAIEYAGEMGGDLVIDGDEPLIAEGAGTIAYELTEQCADDPLDAVLIPLGNGAIATGMGAWLKQRWPSTSVVAVCAQGAPAMAQSWAASAHIETKTVNTIADGIAIRVPVDYALRSMKETVDEVVTVTDDRIIEAMRLVRECLGLIIEPAGAVGIAAILSDPVRWSHTSIGTVLCGSNIDSARAKKWLSD